METQEQVLGMKFHPAFSFCLLFHRVRKKVFPSFLFLKERWLNASIRTAQLGGPLFPFQPLNRLIVISSSSFPSVAFCFPICSNGLMTPGSANMKVFISQVEPPFQDHQNRLLLQRARHRGLHAGDPASQEGVS